MILQGLTRQFGPRDSLIHNSNECLSVTECRDAISRALRRNILRGNAPGGHCWWKDRGPP
jgi:hypothetical protein